MLVTRDHNSAGQPLGKTSGWNLLQNSWVKYSWCNKNIRISEAADALGKI
jgi:hypothetical protein